MVVSSWHHSLRLNVKRKQGGGKRNGRGWLRKGYEGGVEQQRCLFPIKVDCWRITD